MRPGRSRCAALPANAALTVVCTAPQSLITQPGLLTDAYVRGRRKPYLAPLQVFLIANLVFFDRPWVALYGGIAMGAVAIPYAWVLWVGRD